MQTRPPQLHPDTAHNEAKKKSCSSIVHRGKQSGLAVIEENFGFAIGNRRVLSQFHPARVTRAAHHKLQERSSSIVLPNNFRVKTGLALGDSLGQSALSRPYPAGSAELPALPAITRSASWPNVLPKYFRGNFALGGRSGPKGPLIVLSRSRHVRTPKSL